MPRENECYQCGRLEALVWPEEQGPDAWLTCDNCGANIVTLGDMARKAQGAEEERVKQALGFYDFKPGEG